MVKVVKKVACVSGSKGFIGTYLVDRLEKEGWIVWPIERDMLQRPDLLKVYFQLKSPDVIFHLAAFGNLSTQEDIVTTINTNIGGTVNLLQASKDIPFKLLVNFSSSSVTLANETIYSATKAAGERLCKAYYDLFGKPIVSVRPYTVIGKGEHRIHLIPRLIESCKTGKEMPFSAEPTHDFIGVNDFIDALMLIIDNASSLAGKIIPIGTGEKTTNSVIRALVEKAVGQTAAVSLGSPRSYDTNDWVADPTLIKSLGWKQKEKLPDIIGGMVDANNE